MEEAPLGMISLVEIKGLARDRLSEDSMLRRLILAEPDYLPELEAAAKTDLFGRLLHEELGRGS